MGGSKPDRLGVCPIHPIPVTALSLVIWYRGIETLGANQVMIYMYMVIPVAMVIAALFIGEVPNPMQIFGAALTLFGVALASC
ncbi:MAG: EamA family transporter [Bacillota bacterium]|nr:EamA family transporter [Desulforamulus profundi]